MTPVSEQTRRNRVTAGKRAAAATKAKRARMSAQQVLEARMAPALAAMGSETHKTMTFPDIMARLRAAQAAPE